MAPDYELEPSVTVSTPAQMKALADPVRTQILDLVLERAATVTELATALDRPKSSVAYHVDTLVDAGMLKVVRTRKVRAIEERFYGRVGRVIIHDATTHAKGVKPPDFLVTALAEISAPLPEHMHSTLRHARIPQDRAAEFFERVAEVADEFTKLPREGDTVFGFVAAVYRTEHPILPEAAE